MEDTSSDPFDFYSDSIIGGSKFYNEDDRAPAMKASKTFAIIKGGLSPDSRRRIEAIMQSPDNRHGEIVSLVLVSSVGAEGLDFKAIRHIHILEPYWNYARLSQIQFRGIRNDSHKSLTVPEKNVQTYVYCAVPPKGETGLPYDTLELTTFETMKVLDTKAIKEIANVAGLQIIPDTTDVNLLFEAVKNYRVIESFLGPIQRASLTAAIDALTGARLCSPTNKVLYTESVSLDLKMPDTCRPYKTEKIAVTGIMYLDRQYYYAEDLTEATGFKIYGADHKPMKTSDPSYMIILDLIEQAEGLSIL